MISPALREESDAAAGALVGAGRGALGAGAEVGVGGLGAAGRIRVADAAASAALAGAAAGADAALSTTPQCTQNFAPGWFSFPQAAHFIDGSFPGNRV
jgi:hypothetical protein